MVVRKSLLRLTFAAATLALIAAPPGALAQVESGQTFTGKATAVTDGDTCDVHCPDGQLVTVRL